MNGKVHGKVYVGNSPSPVDFTSNDLHSYVVVNDGRSYVAISDIPYTLGPSLQPLSALGGVIGWAFALEQPGFKNGFSIIGEGKTSTTALTMFDNMTPRSFLRDFLILHLVRKSQYSGSVRLCTEMLMLLQAICHTAAVLLSLSS